MAARGVRLPLMLMALAASALRPSTSSLGYDLSPVVEDDLELLPPLSRDVLAGGTEPANRGETACGLYFEQLRPIFREKRPAIFATALGGLPVFSSEDALDLTSGWPGFRRPIAPDHVVLRPDGDTAFECLCARSGACTSATACRRTTAHQRRGAGRAPAGRCLAGRRGAGRARGGCAPVLAAVLGGNLSQCPLAVRSGGETGPSPRRRIPRQSRRSPMVASSLAR